MSLILIRGLPGSGKSTLAQQIAENVFETDQFWMRSGVYQFDKSRLQEAHDDCFARVEKHLRELSKVWCILRNQPTLRNVAVANTFSQRWEFDRYLKLAASIPLLNRNKEDPERMPVFVIDLFDGGLSDVQLKTRCKHRVSIETISNMRFRWTHTWGTAPSERSGKP